MRVFVGDEGEVGLAVGAVVVIEPVTDNPSASSSKECDVAWTYRAM